MNCLKLGIVAHVCVSLEFFLSRSFCDSARQQYMGAVKDGVDVDVQKPEQTIQFEDNEINFNLHKFRSQIPSFSDN